MRIPWATTILLAATGAVTANAEETIAVDVRLSDPLSSPKILARNKKIVTSIFEKAGVRIQWRDGDAGPGSFDIRVVDHAPPSASPDALAAAVLASGAVTVYEDRVRQRLSRAHPGAARVALAYVFAHELAHAMQGVDRHSPAGILKAHWSNDDFTAMLFQTLEFTDADAKLIRLGLSTRQSQMATAVK